MTETAKSPIIPFKEPGQDGRQSQAALEIQRGVGRVLSAHGFASVPELTLKNGRRADIFGLGRKGEIWIVEIKSGVEDFRADNKWSEYRDYCDCFFFAVATDFPVEILPDDTGLIVADRFGGDILKPAPVHSLSGARRKAVTLIFAQTAAMRLARAVEAATWNGKNET